MIGKEWTFGLVQNENYSELTGKITVSDFGENYVHFEGTGDDDGTSFELRKSSIIYFYENESEEEEVPAEEEPVEEPIKRKYSNRSVNEIEKKKKGWF